MTGFQFLAECCPEGWMVEQSCVSGAMSRVWVRCRGCGDGRVVTVSWRPYRREEAA